MLLLRLSPIVPFCVINYLIAGTSLSLRDYVTSLFGILPGTVAYVFIGTTLSNYLGFQDDNHHDDKANNEKTTKWIQLVSLLIGIILTLVATILLSYHARKELLKYQTRSQESEDVVSYSPDMSPFHGSQSGGVNGLTGIAREDSIESRHSSSRHSSKQSGGRSTKSSYIGGDTIDEYSVYM